MSPQLEAAQAAWQALLADDTPWGAVDDDALLAALEARDRAFDAAARATAELSMGALAPDERDALQQMLGRVAAATLSLEQRVIGRRAAVAAALDATVDLAAPGARSPYARPLAAARLDLRR